MHAGTRVIRLRGVKTELGSNEAGVANADSVTWEYEFEIVARFEEHESMNYASDVQPLVTTSGALMTTGRTVVSTSFYDKLMCLWRIP